MEFWECTPTEFNLRLEGWREVQEAQSRERWEQTRHLAYLSLLPHVDKSKPLKITDVLKFPWDANPRQEPALERSDILSLMKSKGLKLSGDMEKELKND